MQLEQAKTRATAANKLALEAEKEKDAAEQAVETTTARCFCMQGHHVMFFFSVSRCVEALCQKAI